MNQEQKKRLCELHVLEQKVRSTILGHPLEDRGELTRLHDIVKEEIRNLRKVDTTQS